MPPLLEHAARRPKPQSHGDRGELEMMGPILKEHQRHVFSCSPPNRTFSLARFPLTSSVARKCAKTPFTVVLHLQLHMEAANTDPTKQVVHARPLWSRWHLRPARHSGLLPLNPPGLTPFHCSRLRPLRSWLVGSGLTGSGNAHSRLWSLPSSSPSDSSSGT